MAEGVFVQHFITFENLSKMDKGTTIWFWGGGGGGGPGTFGRDRLFIFITGSAGKFISG